MKLTRHFPQSYDTLRDLTIAAVGNAHSVVFQAGHFLLVYDEHSRAISACIHGAPSNTKHAALAENYGRFPILTWKLALRLLGELTVPSKHIMIVVNDWQYLPKEAKRSDFYLQQASRLPAEYLDALNMHSPRISLLVPPPIKNGVSTAPFFGEMNLRNRYHRRVAKLVASGHLPPTAVVEETEAGVSCSLPDLSGRLQEIYCSGKTGDCTAEIAEMLREANKRTGAPCFVNLYPVVCRDFVELGTTRAVELFRAPLESVLNIGFPSAGVSSEDDLFAGCEASLHRFV